jgi:hypothetical protein
LRYRGQRDPGEAAQDGDHQCGENEVNDGQGPVADRDAARAGHGVRHAHHVVDDPWLPADLGGDPPRDEGDHRQRAGRDHRREQPAGQAAAAQAQEQVHQGDDGQQRADADHRLECQAHHVHRRLVGQRDDVQAAHHRVRVVVGQQGQQPGDLHAPYHRVPVVPAEQVLGGAPRGGGQALHGRELDRLVDGDVAGRPVADDHLQGRRHRRGAERDRQRGALVAAAAAAQERPGVRGGQQEPAHDERGEVHVDVLAPKQRVAEQGLPRVHVDRPAIAHGEAGRVVHPAVDRDDEQ